MNPKPLYKSVSKKVLASAYDISFKTLHSWLLPIEDELGDYLGKTYTPKQVERIVKLLGEPEHIKLIRAE